MARRDTSGKLVLYGTEGKRIERPVDRVLLEQLLERVLQTCDSVAGLAWDKTGVMTTRHLLGCWPEALRTPTAAFLRSGKRFHTGMALQIEAPGEDLDEYADDLVRCLSGKDPVLRFDTRPVAEEDDLDQAGQDKADNTVELILDTAEEVTPFDLETDAFPGEVPIQPAAEKQEVLPPGGRRKEETGRRWQLTEEDVFTVVGPLHPEDAFDDTLEILPEDLPWLNPGDRINSAKRGQCRILRAEPDNSQFLVRDAGGQILMLQAKELLAEFSFDDEKPGMRRASPPDDAHQ